MGVRARETRRFFRPSPQRLNDYLRGLPGAAHSELQRQLNELYAPCCAHEEQLADFSDADLNKFVEQMVDSIFNSKQLPEGGFDKKVAGQYGKRFFDGIENGYGKTLSVGDFKTPDLEMVAQLQKNAYVFAAAKTFQEAKAITEQLVDTNGKVRSFKDFQVAANLITSEHNRWLVNEYNTAISSAQMAAKWVEIQKNKHLLPLLQFDAILDSHTTELCASLNGVIRPVDDPFWNEYYPPNHWNCRSSVRQLANASITPVEDIHPNANIPDLFKQNLAKNSLAFPATHPYYKGVPEGIDDVAMQTLRKEALLEAYKNIRNKEFEIPGFGKAKVSRVSINKIASQATDKKFEQLLLLQKLPDLVQKMVQIKNAPDTKGRDGFHYYYFEIKDLEGWYINVREQQDGSYLIYSITDKIK